MKLIFLLLSCLSLNLMAAEVQQRGRVEEAIQDLRELEARLVRPLPLPMIYKLMKWNLFLQLKKVPHVTKERVLSLFEAVLSLGSFKQGDPLLLSSCFYIVLAHLNQDALKSEGEIKAFFKLKDLQKTKMLAKKIQKELGVRSEVGDEVEEGSVRSSIFFILYKNFLGLQFDSSLKGVAYQHLGWLDDYRTSRSDLAAVALYAGLLHSDLQWDDDCIQITGKTKEEIKALLEALKINVKESVEWIFKKRANRFLNAFLQGSDQPEFSRESL